MSMSSSAFSVATPSSEPSSVAIGKDQIETSPLAPNPNPNPNPTDLHFAPVVDEGSSGSLQVTAALFSDLFHPPSSSDGVSDKIPEPFTEGWKPHLSVSATDFSYASEERRGHRHHHLHHSYADGDSLEGENESLALKKQNVRPSVYERESSSMASKADVFSATGGDVKELVVNESEVKLVQRAVKKKTKKKIYHKNGWWNETKISRAVWPMAMAVVGCFCCCRSHIDMGLGEEGVGRNKRLERKRIGFTTPAHYASRLQHLLHLEGAATVWAPSVSIQATDTSCQISSLFSSSSPPAGIAFTSRAGIQAIHEALRRNPSPPDIPDGCHLAPHHARFFLAALGRDADLALELDLFGVRSSNKVKLIVPCEATPKAMVEELGFGNGRSVLCPVPSVQGGLEEPPVVPEFLAHLAQNAWFPLRMDAYVTTWIGGHCALPLLPLSSLDALVFTSTAEVEGLLKSLHTLNIPHVESSLNGPKPVIAAHGPVTAAGAARFGFRPHVVSRNSSSFHGIVDALDLYWRSLPN